MKTKTTISVTIESDGGVYQVTYHSLPDFLATCDPRQLTAALAVVLGVNPHELANSMVTAQTAALRRARDEQGKE